MSSTTPARDIEAPIQRATLDLTSPRGKSFDGFSRLLINILLDQDGGLRRIGGWVTPEGSNGDLHDQLLSALDAPLSPITSSLEIYNHPDDVWFVVGRGFSMWSEAKGGVPPYSWQWYYLSGGNWLKIVTSGTAGGGEVLMGDVDGAESQSLMVSNAQLDRVGLYRVVVTDSAGSSVTSQQALASSGVDSETGVAPSFMVQPESRSIDSGGAVALWVATIGSTPVTYQWEQRVGPAWSVMVGETSDNLTVGPIAGPATKYYRCIATNAYGSATSETATISVASPSGSYGDLHLDNQTYRCGLSDTKVFTITNPSVTETLTIVWSAAIGLCAGTIDTPPDTIVAPGDSEDVSIQWDLTGCVASEEIPDFRLDGAATFPIATGFNVYLTGGTSNLCP